MRRRLGAVLAFFAGRALVPQVLFVILLAAGWYLGRLWGRRIVTFVALWLAGAVTVSLFPQIAPAFTAWIALLDIALVLIVFKGDVRI